MHTTHYHSLTGSLTRTNQFDRDILQEDLPYLICQLDPSLAPTMTEIVAEIELGRYDSYLQRAIYNVITACRDYRANKGMSSERRNIDTTIKRFVKDPRRLRECMRDVGGLIHGGLALQFIVGVEWPESDLDICVHKNKVQQLIDYFVHVEGYDLACSKIGKYNWAEIEAVHILDKPILNPEVRKTIDVVVTKGEPIQSILAETHTTLLLNIISYNAAYSVS